VNNGEAIGVDLGGTKMLVGAIEANAARSGELPAVHYRATERSIGLEADGILDELTEEIGRAAKARPGAARAVGLGIPCTIDRERGLAITAVNLPIVRMPIRDLMRERLGAPVFIDNDANVAALAEHRYGAARGARQALMLTVGTGIGGGVIVDGDLYRGAVGAGGELGHVVVDLNGPRCQGNCPNRGCVEAFASGTAIAREGRLAAEGSPESVLGQRLAAGEQIDGRAVTEAALAGDGPARQVVAAAGRYLGVALASLANAFEPDVIVIGGGVMALGDLLLDPARAELRSRALSPMNQIPVVPAQLGPEAGMIGAATMALLESEGSD
jgi:glucokinase